MTPFSEEIRNVMSDAWRPPPDLTVSEWADQYRQLSPEASAEPGQWYTSRAPYLKAIMDAYNDPRWQEIVCMMASQCAKTEAINNIIGYNVDLSPAPMLVVQPTLDMAEAWSKDRLAPMLRDSPTLKEKTTRRSRDGSSTLLHKQFPGGHVTMAGANSPASLASRPVRDVLADEIDRYPPSAGNEGDPLNLAVARTANFWNAKIVMTSTPTIKGASRIEDAYQKSQQHQFFLPCPHCGTYQTLRWPQIIIPKAPDGRYLTKNTYYACEAGCEIHETHKHWMLANGEWRQVGEGSLVRRIGFHINSIYSPWMTWNKLADLFIEAGSEPELLQTFINTKLAETWELKFGGGKQLTAGNACEDYDDENLPDNILLITCAVDTQDDRLEMLSQGWGQKRERWNIEHKIFWGDTSRDAVWFELDEYLKRKYRVGGRDLPIAITGIDSGGSRTQEVYNFVKSRQHRRIFALKGSSSYYAPVANNGRQVGIQRVMLYEVGTDTAKDSILYSSLQLTSPGPGYIHHPKWCDQEYFDQLSMSEVRIKNKPTDRLGRKKRINRLFEYQKLRERNEILDLHVYNMAAYYILNPDIDVISAKRQGSENVKPLKEPERPFTPLRPMRHRKVSRRKNWVRDI